MTVKAGLQQIEEHLLPEKGRIGIRIRLESDLFGHENNEPNNKGRIGANAAPTASVKQAR